MWIQPSTLTGGALEDLTFSELVDFWAECEIDRQLREVELFSASIVADQEQLSSRSQAKELTRGVLSHTVGLVAQVAQELLGPGTLLGSQRRGVKQRLQRRPGGGRIAAGRLSPHQRRGQGENPYGQRDLFRTNWHPCCPRKEGARGRPGLWAGKSRGPVVVYVRDRHVLAGISQIGL